MSYHALGLIETNGLVAAIEACDAAAKAAGVVVAAAELTDAAYMTIKVEGELGAVQAAVEAGAAAAQRVGELVAIHVIPRPDDGLGPIMPPRRYVSKYHPDDTRPPLDPDDADSDLPFGSPPPPRRPSGGRAPAKPPARREVTPEKPTKSEAQPRSATSTPQQPRQEKGAIAPPDWEAVEKMPVVKLRRFARTIPDLPIQGREISMANKTQLLEAIRSVWKEK